MAYAGAIERPVWQDMMITLSPAKLNRSFKSFVCMDDGRFDATSQDSKTIDPAQLFVFSESTVVTLGKLWVEYEVDLFEPQIPISPNNQGGGNLTFPVTGSFSSSGLSVAASPVATVPVSTLSPPMSSIIEPNQASYSTLATAAQAQTLAGLGETINTFPNSLLGMFAKDYIGNMTATLEGLPSTPTTKPVFSIIRPDGSQSDLGSGTQNFFSNTATLGGTAGYRVADPVNTLPGVNYGPVPKGSILRQKAGFTWPGGTPAGAISEFLRFGGVSGF